MALDVGTRLGPYEIVALLGAGGMGEVYRARDPRLGRDVAIKVLPTSVSTDHERLTRFEQEARAAAALNHPNILAVHDVARHGETPYIVSELLEGETLRERLAGDVLPVRKAIEYGIQIARGLAAAHDKGIVHRDLKPDNIFLTVGPVKILDFGLAKLLQDEPAVSNASVLPTTPPQTVPGVVLGTMGYMSPEQVRGLAADHRSDIFAFGAVLYEMLAGRQAFRADTAMDSMTAILRDEPPDLPIGERQIPPALERIVKRCLEKSPAARFKSADDLAFALEGLTTPSSGALPAISAGGPRRRERLVWIAALVLLAIVAAAMAVLALRPRPVAPDPERRVEITTPPTPDEVSIALSPDGEKVAFVASTDGRPQLWLRSLRSGVARPLAGTDGATFPFWSPDSQSIGFFANERVNRIDIDGGSFRVLARAPVPAGGAWSRDGVILYPPVPDAPIFRVSAAGGDTTMLPGARPGQGGNRFPQFLPDGRRFLYYMADVSSRGVYVGSLDGPERRRLFDADAAPVVMPPSHVLVVRAGTLFAQRFDPVTLALEGTAVTLAEGVNVDSIGVGAMSASATGSIIYRVGSASRQRQLTWFDRAGRSLGDVHGPDSANLLNPELSPDGRVLAVGRTVNGNTDIWLLELSRRVLTRFTSDPTPDIAAVWSPDGGHIVFSATDGGGSAGFHLAQKSTAAGGTASTLLDVADTLVATDWSRDGRFVLFGKVPPLGPTEPPTGTDVWALPMTDKGTPIPVAQTKADERTAQFSPDGHWVAFESNESGRFEIHVQQFPNPGTKVVVSTGGGLQPRWRHDGQELFYIAPDGRLMAVALRFPSSSTVEPSSPVPLFNARVGSTFIGGSKMQYVAAPDGRFLMNTLTEHAAAPITLILNWAQAQH
jgi:Tol biopolymer transport system component